MHEDDLARLNAEMEQAREGIKQLAANLATFYKGLIDEGFFPEDALVLTRTMLQQWVGDDDA